MGDARFAVWNVTFANTGSVNEHVSGTIKVRSLFGTTVHTLQLKDLLVLRGATRTQRVVWSELPWVGAFRPIVSVRDDDGKRVEAQGPWVTVLPWWLPVLAAALILLPVVMWWLRRRREWKQYLAEALAELEQEEHGY